MSGARLPPPPPPPKQILGIIIILITWSYVLQDIFVDLEMTGMDEVLFWPPPPHPSNFLLRHCAVKFFFGRLSFV